MLPCGQRIVCPGLRRRPPAERAARIVTVFAKPLPSMNDPALDALFLPIDHGPLAWPQGGALFLRARPGVALFARPRPGLVCEQGFKPAFDALQQAGFEAQADGDAAFPLVLLLPPRQRDEARALFAEAFARSAPGGFVVASMANDAGAKSGQADFERLFGGASVLSKHKCRVF